MNIVFMIVGDLANPLPTWLIMGYQGVILPRKESFNVYLNSTRVVVEMAFVRLKGHVKWTACIHLLQKFYCNLLYVI